MNGKVVEDHHLANKYQKMSTNFFWPRHKALFMYWVTHKLICFYLYRVHRRLEVNLLKITQSKSKTQITRSVQGKFNCITVKNTARQ